MSQNGPIKPVPNSYLIAIITHIFISWGYLELTDLSIRHLEHNAYLSLILAVPFILPFVWIIYDLASIFPGKPISYVIESAFGRWLGKLVTLIYILMLFGLAIQTLWESQLMVGSYFLVQIDVRILVVVIAGLTLYLASHGVEAVGRLAAFLLIIPLVIIYGLQFLGLSNINPLNIRPLLEGSARQWFEAGFDMLFILTAASAAFPYLPFFKNPKSVLRTLLISLGLVVPLFFLTIIGTIGAFGPKMTAKITWPAVEFFNIIDLPIILLEQVGLIFIITWYAFVFIILAQAFFILGHLISTAFPAFKLKWATITAALIITIVTLLLPQSAITVKSILQSTVRYFIVSYYSIILLTWILVRLRHRRPTLHN